MPAVCRSTHRPISGQAETLAESAVGWARRILSVNRQLDFASAPADLRGLIAQALASAARVLLSLALERLDTGINSQVTAQLLDRSLGQARERILRCVTGLHSSSVMRRRP